MKDDIEEEDESKSSIDHDDLCLLTSHCPSRPDATQVGGQDADC